MHPTLRSLSLFTVAVLAASGAQAQFTIYGRANIDFEKVSIGGTPASDAFGGNQRVSSNSSRFGIRAAKDFDGLKLFAQIESGVSVDAGGDTLASRDTFAGLEGGFGKLRLGKMDSPFKDLGGLTDRFKGTGVQDDGSIAVLGGSGGGFGRRLNNSVRYDTPNLGGFRAAVHYSLDSEDVASSAQKKIISLSGSFDIDKLKTAVAYEQHKNLNAVGFDDAGLRVGANYDFGFLNLGAGFNRLSYEVAAGTLTRKYATVTAGVPVGNGAINLRFGKAGGVGGSAPVGTTISGADGVSLYRGAEGAHQYTVGYEHNLFKGAQLYGYWTKIDNKTNANYRFGVNALNVTAADRGADPSAFVIGLLYDF